VSQVAAFRKEVTMGDSVSFSWLLSLQPDAAPAAPLSQLFSILGMGLLASCLLSGHAPCFSQSSSFSIWAVVQSPGLIIERSSGSQKHLSVKLL